MVRKVGNLSPINAPALYDISGENMQKVGQDVQQASQASMQALSALGQAYGANTQRLYNDQATLEKARMMQAQADAENNQGGGGLLGGLSTVFNSFVGGITAAEEVKAKKQALELQQQEAQRKASLEERNQALDENKFSHQQSQDERKFSYQQSQDVLKQEGEAQKSQIELLGSYVEQSLAESYAQLETAFVNLTQEQGVTYADKMFEQQAAQFGQLFEAYPELRVKYYTGSAKIRQDLQKRYSNKYSEVLKDDRNLIVNTMESKMQLALATRKEEIAYSAGTWDAATASNELNSTISLGMQTAMSDPQFQKAVQQDPSLMGVFYGKVLASVLPSYQEYAKKNAEISSEVTKLETANAIFASNPDLSDPATISDLSVVLSKLGLPQYSKDPSSYPSSQLNRAEYTKKLFNAQQDLETAVKSDNPMFSLDRPEHLMVANSLKGQQLFDAVNQKNGESLEAVINRADGKAKEASSRKDFKSEAYWSSYVDFFKGYESDRTAYQSLKEKSNKLLSEYRKMTTPQTDTTVIPDGLSATRVNVGGEKLPPKYSQEEIERNKAMQQEVNLQILQVQNKWKVNGLDLEDLSNPAFLDNLKNQAAPYVNQLTKQLMSSGQISDTGSEALNYTLTPQTPKSNLASSRGVKPLNFTGGRTQTSLVTQAKANALPFPDNVAPLTPSVPVNGTLASLQGVGIVPFKGGDVSIVNEGTKGLTLKSTDSRVATMIGGKVVYAGGTQTMGNVVVVQTSDGLAEVYSNIKGANVKAGDHVPIGTVLGTSDKLDFQVWQTTDALGALRKEGLRNELNPLQYLSGMMVSVKLPNGLGSLDITKDRPTIVAGGNSNMFASGNYSVYGDMVFDKRTNKIRKLTKAENSYLYPNGMKTERAKAEERYAENARPSSPSGMVYFGGATNMKTLGNVLQQDGVVIREYAPFDKVDPIHGVNSDHYKGLAMDLQGTPEKLRKYADELAASADGTGIKQVIYKGKIWNDDGKGWRKFTPKKGARGDAMHNGHVHVSFRGEEFKPKSNGVYYPTPKATDTFNTGNSKQTSNLRAFADVISYSEGTERYGYGTYFGGGQFDNSQPHPQRVLNGSSAAGRYQFMPDTWKDIHNGKNPPMTVAAQDAAFISLLKGKGAYEDVLNGNFEQAFKKVAYTWSSVKGNNYTYKGKPQGRYSPNTLAERARGKANGYNGKIKQPTSSVITDRPMKVTKASVSPSAYGKPNSSYNFGYQRLTEEGQLRRAVFKAAVFTGVPQQFIADIFGAYTRGYTKPITPSQIDEFSFKLYGKGKGLSITEVAKKMGVPVYLDSLGNEAGRSYTNGTKEYHSHPRSNCPVCQQILRSGSAFVPHSK
jgi:muramidase (phage lysozyme)/murein DD-endopeptidase MepM/ murein hydrolase activator NlpD